MRFLLEFALCCGCAPQRSPVPKTSSSFSTYEEERRSFVLLPPRSHSSRPRRSRKRRRLAAGSEWEPSLGPICEDDVVPQRYDSVGSKREGKRRSDVANALPYSDNIPDYDCRQPAVSNIITAFSPTPYMF